MVDEIAGGGEEIGQTPSHDKKCGSEIAWYKKGYRKNVSKSQEKMTKYGFSGEPKSGRHVTITHQILASVDRVLCIKILPRSDEKWWETLRKIFLAYYFTL